MSGINEERNKEGKITRNKTDDPTKGHNLAVNGRPISTVYKISTCLYININYKFVNASRKGNVLFNDALNTFYLRLYGVGHMVKDHSDSERGNPLPPHRLLFPINSKGSFICTIPQTG